MSERDSAPQELLFGFTRAEWAAAAGFADESFELFREIASRPHSEWPAAAHIDPTQWLLMARTSPAHAAGVLRVVGPMWQGWADARRSRIPDIADPDLQIDHLEWAREYEAMVAQLRELAGIPNE